MKMAKVKRCEAGECSYNADNLCHTPAITVGDDAVHPMCDTFCMSSIKGGNGKIVAGIGACKVSECMFNEALECQSSEVRIGHQGNEVDCLTFKMR